MSRFALAWIAIATLTAGVAIVGCNSASNRAADSSMPADHVDAHAEMADEESDADETIVEAFASLSSDDRPAAEKQKICPVSGEALGTMGTPIKVDVNGKTVFICCEGCREKLLNNPEDYLAKLNK